MTVRLVETRIASTPSASYITLTNAPDNGREYNMVVAVAVARWDGGMSVLPANFPEIESPPTYGPSEIPFTEAGVVSHLYYYQSQFWREQLYLFYIEDPPASLGADTICYFGDEDSSPPAGLSQNTTWIFFNLSNARYTGEIGLVSVRHDESTGTTDDPILTSHLSGLEGAVIGAVNFPADVVGDHTREPAGNSRLDVRSIDVYNGMVGAIYFCPHLGDAWLQQTCGFRPGTYSGGVGIQCGIHSAIIGG